MTQLTLVSGATVIDGYAKSATMSADGLYRYNLFRGWDDGPLMVWIMLNPSTADGEVDDPTIRRCMGFARRQGFGAIEVVNLYALRATKPEHLLDHPDPEGPCNPTAWAEALLDYPEPELVVAAWGAGADKLDGLPESTALRGCSSSFHCLGTTKEGFPRHPLYVKADQPLEAWR